MNRSILIYGITYFLIGLMVLGMCSSLYGQENKSQIPLTLSFTQASLQEIIAELRQSCQCPIYHSVPEVEVPLFSGSFQGQSAEQILAVVLEHTSLSFLSYENQVLLIGLRSNIGREVDSDFFQNLENEQSIANTISKSSAKEEVKDDAFVLEEVVLEAQARNENIQSTQTGLIRMKIQEMETLPSFLGEVDVVKSLLLQPGVSTIGEGSGGFHVRGGNADQNLVLMDEAILFNTSHALGFFSAFHSDIVSEATLYKGNMPASYGGRISSTLNVHVKEGNFEKLRLKGGIGIVSSRLSLEGPIRKGKTSFLISGRSSYSDWLLRASRLPELQNSSAFFYDANLKLTHRFGDQNILRLGAYQSYDQFIYNNRFGFDYQTSIAQFSYQRLLGKQFLSTFHAIYGSYRSSQDELRPSLASSLHVGTSYWKLKEHVNYSAGKLSADAGLSSIFYRINPGILEATSPQSVIEGELVEPEKGIEMAAYLSGTYDVSRRLAFIAGLRYTYYQSSSGASFSQGVPEPRVSMRYKLDTESSIKFGYTRSSQFINQISNTASPIPTHIWQLSAQQIPPHLSHNLSVGYFRNFNQDTWITSFDIFYRHIDQLFDIKDFADIIANDQIEHELRPGIGRSRGLELSIKKQGGRLHGWLSYTLSRSERKVQTINQGQWYPSSFDKPHEVSLVANIQVSKRNTVSINFNYASGRPSTIPLDRHLVDNRLILPNYSLRNAYRIPDYHRLDIAYTLGKGYRISQKFKTSWTLSIYNVYGRKNAFAVYVDQEIIGEPRIKRLAVLGSAFPALTLNVELL